MAVNGNTVFAPSQNTSCSVKNEGDLIADETVDWRDCTEFVDGVLSNVIENTFDGCPVDNPEFPEYPAISTFEGAITCIWDVATQTWLEYDTTTNQIIEHTTNVTCPTDDPEDPTVPALATFNGEITCVWDVATQTWIQIIGGAGSTSIVTDLGNGLYQHNDGLGTIEQWQVGDSIVNNNNGTITVTRVDGTTFTFNIGGVLVDNGDTTFTFTNPDNTTITFNDHSEVTLVELSDTASNILNTSFGIYLPYVIPLDGIYHVWGWVDAIGSGGGFPDDVGHLEINIRIPDGVSQAQGMMNGFVTVQASYTGQFTAGDTVFLAIFRGGTQANVGTLTSTAIRHHITLLRRT